MILSCHDDNSYSLGEVLRRYRISLMPSSPELLGPDWMMHHYISINDFVNPLTGEPFVNLSQVSLHSAVGLASVLTFDDYPADGDTETT